MISTRSLDQTNLKTLTGSTMKRMLEGGLALIQEKEEDINDMNVFPVPDGDTGTNMKMTLRRGLQEAGNSENLGLYLYRVKRGMLLGARGNSGVILSQLFAGLSDALLNKDSATTIDFADALTAAYQNAYASVINPVEGTILTVTREGIVNIRQEISENTSFEELFNLYIEEMKRSLEKTPRLLPVLAASGVLDSGAAGYILIIEGMLCALRGEEIQMVEEVLPEKKETEISSFDTFTDGYCTEFLLQLMKGEGYDQNFSLPAFIERLKDLGTSLVALQDKDIVKVHIHTLKPAPVITEAQKYGEFLTFKLENMQIQHNEFIQKAEEKKPVHKHLAIVAVANGDGVTSLFRDLGCDAVIDGGTTMNTPVESFLEEFSHLNADRIVVFPNNPNLIKTAEQAAALSGRKGITILRTNDIIQCYYALALSNSGNEDSDVRIQAMENGMNSVDVISVATASHDYTEGSTSCRKGDCIALLNGDLAASGETSETVVINTLKQIEDFQDKESVVVFKGCDVGENEADLLQEAIEKVLPYAEVAVLDGGQKIYRFVLGV